MSTVPRPDPGSVGCVRLFTLRRKSRVLLIRIHAHPRAKCPVLGLLVCMTASVQGEGSGFPLRRERRRVGRPFCVGVGVVACRQGLWIPVATGNTGGGENNLRVGGRGCSPTRALDSRCDEKDVGLGRTFCVWVGVVARRRGLWIPVATRKTGGWGEHFACGWAWLLTNS